MEDICGPISGIKDITESLCHAYGGMTYQTFKEEDATSGKKDLNFAFGLFFKRQYVFCSSNFNWTNFIPLVHLCSKYHRVCLLIGLFVESTGS